MSPAQNKRQSKGDGFPGQRIVVLPPSVIARAENHALMGGVIPTDIGFFPRATGHLRERKSGVGEAIFIYCVKGAGWCEFGERRHEVKAGDVLVIPPRTAHRYGAHPTRPWSIHWFHARGPQLAGFLDELEANPDQPVRALGDSPQVLALFEDVLAVLEQGYTTQQLLYASHALTHLLAVLIREQRQGRHQEPGIPQRIIKTIDYMKQHLHQPLRLDAMAAIANLSRSQYTTLFKQQSGYTPMDYFTRLRVHRSCQLLDTTTESVKAIAISLGYDDPLYFSRVFRSVTEVSPQAYREARKG